MRWKIVNKKKGRKLHISEIPDGVLSVDLSYIPNGMTISEYLQFIQDTGIVIRYDE